jgi:flagellar basal-body rod protein FlgB
MVDFTATSLEKYMDLLSAREKLVASNIANADTPGYKTRDVNFQDEFQSLLEGGKPEAVEVAGLKTKNDGNNVDVDRESRMLSETALRFSTASNLMRAQFRVLKSAITEGKS